jgi:hypothetical protein
VITDSDSLITEQDEDNNEATRVIFACENAPDLYVLAEEISGENITGDVSSSTSPVGQRFWFRCVVRNSGGRGAAATASFYYQIDQDWNFMGSDDVYVMPNEFAGAEVMWVPIVPECMIKVEVTGTDPPEQSYGNNVAEVFMNLWTVSVEEPRAPLPRFAMLYPNAPNPFNPSTTLRLDLPDTRRVSLRVYDIQGRLVRELLDAKMAAGQYALRWNGKNEAGHEVAGGVYFCRMEAGNYSRTLKIVLLK